MNFNELEQSVNKMATFFNLNVKLIDLSKERDFKKPSRQDYNTDTDEEVEDLFEFNQGKRIKIKSDNSQQKEKIKKELDYLNKEHDKLNDLMKNMHSELSHHEECHENREHTEYEHEHEHEHEHHERHEHHENREHREHHENREHERHEHHENREHREHHENREHREHHENREHREHHENREHERHEHHENRGYRENTERRNKVENINKYKMDARNIMKN